MESSRTSSISRQQHGGGSETDDDDGNHGFPLMDMGRDQQRLGNVDPFSDVTPLTAGEPWEHLMTSPRPMRNEEPEQRRHPANSAQPVKTLRQTSLADKLGVRARFVLALAPLVTVGTLGFIAFLWFGGGNNASVWHRFMVKSWATRAVSISALVIRFATSLQAGIGVAMLAALALELYGVPFTDAAAVAVMRSGEITPQTLFTQTVIGFRRRPTSLHWLYTILAVVLFATTTLLQLTSTALLSDLQLGLLPGSSSSSFVPYDFVYNTTALNQNQSFIPLIRRQTPWTRNPQFYPTFAEFSSPAPSRSDVDDTGILLRAFLPMTDSRQRQILRNYTGKAFVLDSRVACQKPLLKNLQLSWDPSSGNVFAMNGSYANSTYSQNLLTPDGPVRFTCPSYFYSNGYTICQLANNGVGIGNPAGALQSAFANASSKNIFGAPYLVFNSSINVVELTQNGTPPLNPVHGQDSGVWSHWQISRDELGENGTSGQVADLNFTLCYTAFDAARLDLDFYSDSSRFEPLPEFKTSAQSYSFSDVLAQLGVDATILGARDRGILQIEERDSWIPSPDDALPEGVQPWVQGTSDMSSVSIIPAKLINHHTTGNLSSVLDTMDLWYMTANMINTDPSLVSLFTEIMTKNGSIAAAMSSLVTVLSSMAYYDQIAQFQASGPIGLVYFETVLFPHGSRGLTAVFITICLQLGVILVISMMFWKYTRLTMIGNAWQSIAQIVTPLTEELLNDNTLATDSSVEQQMKREGSVADRVKLAPLQDAGRKRYGLVRNGLGNLRSRR